MRYISHLARKIIRIVALTVAVLTMTTSLASYANDDTGSVARAIVTSSIENREPVDQLDVVGSEISKVYFFTEARNLANRTLIHKWYLNDRLEAEVVLSIGSNRWRTYSSKNLSAPVHYGQWRVDAVLEDGTVLGSATFNYQ